MYGDIDAREEQAFEDHRDMILGRTGDPHEHDPEYSLGDRAEDHYDPEDPVTEIARESPEAAGLVYQLVTASMNANVKTMDSLYEQERELRQAYEVLLSDALQRLDDAHMGSAREYEQAVIPLRHGVCGRVSELAARHRQNTEEN